MNTLIITKAILLLQPEGELWRFSVTGNVTDSATFLENITWEDGTVKCTWEEAQSKITEAEVDHNTTAVQVRRKKAYETESDQLFFKEQRGEIPAGTWNAKISEIKTRFPKG
jgi:hypothetical protein